MKSIERLTKLADRFARKISLAQAAPPTVEEDPTAVVADAFFGPPGGGQDEKFFQSKILDQNSNFSKALPDSVNTAQIGATVDAATKAANFLLTTDPVTAPNVRAAIIAALVKDYTAAYGAAPAARFAARLAKGDIRPANVHATANTIITIS